MGCKAVGGGRGAEVARLEEESLRAQVSFWIVVFAGETMWSQSEEKKLRPPTPKGRKKGGLEWKKKCWCCGEMLLGPRKCNPQTTPENDRRKKGLSG